MSAECALWYFRNWSLYVDVYDDEQDAARDAVSWSDEGEAAIRGVQYPDGRYVSRDEWTAYTAEEQRREEQWRAEEKRAARTTPPATRQVVPPFEDSYGRKATVLADAPNWLGAQVASR